MTLRKSIVVLALCALVVGCARSSAAPSNMPPPPQVSVARVLVKKVQDWQDFTGRLEAVNSVELRPRVSGHIESVRFTEGARVKKDQVLYQIDARSFREEVNRLSAEQRRGESQLALARANLKRGQKLVEEGAATAGELDQLQAAEAGAAAGLDGIRAALAQARLNLEFTNVRSPIAGRVSNARITAGNLVSSADQLTRIVSDDPIYTYFDVDEAAFLALTRERTAQAKVQMGLSADEGYPHAGKLDFIDNQVDPRTGTIRARAVFDNRDGKFTPGLFTRVRLLNDREFEAVLIDDKALMTDQNRKYVFVVDESKRAQRRDVKIGRMVDGLRIVSEGLKAGDRVIVQGIQKVFMPGMPVQAEEVAMLAPKASVAKN